MPGFLKANRTSTHRHRAFRDGMKIVKDANSNNSIASTTIQNLTQGEKRSKKRRKNSSEAMYITSASVPDSMIAFTNAIHLVSVQLHGILF